MLKSLKLEGVGPVPGLTAEFGDRLNVLTGDNGLGKSFLLDVCFWSLTGTWPGGRTAMPPPPNGKKNKATITYEIKAQGATKKEAKTAKYDFATQTWTRPKGRPFKPGLVIYASVDGGFAVWDPSRNYWRDPTTGAKQGEEQPRAFQFTPETLANGLKRGESTICNGLIQDWVNWFLENNSTHESKDSKQNYPLKILEAVVARLCQPSEPITIGEPHRIYIDQTNLYPVLNMSYGDIAFPHWSAGLRRIISMAYLIVWTYTEHFQAAWLRGEQRAQRLILLVDEIETHLNPKWQRTILPAIVSVLNSLHRNVEVQVIAATHSPLVLASLEADFDKSQDKLFWFDLQGKDVTFQDYPWAAQGDVVGWLTSEIFGLKQARSTEAETAIEAAEAFMRGDLEQLPEGMETKAAIHKALLATLPGMDPFWPRWIVETKG